MISQRSEIGPRLVKLIAMMICFTSCTAAAQTIESLIMPGDLIRGHAELEAECSSCHVSFNRAGQDVLCRDCHEEIDENPYEPVP